jgi:alkylhydroperoxidase family enzyme
VTGSVPPVNSRHRIEPGTREQIGRVNFALARLLGAATGGPPPNVFTTLARHRTLFRPWLRFAGRLMPGGRLPRDESELLILRVAHNCDSDYEWRQHARIGLTAGLTEAEVERVRSGPDAPGWSDRRALLLSAADELHTDRVISDAVWGRLAELLSDEDLLELCMLVGHYEMLAMTLNSAGVQLEKLPSGPPSRGMRALQSLSQRRSRR